MFAELPPVVLPVFCTTPQLDTGQQQLGDGKWGEEPSAPPLQLNTGGGGGGRTEDQGPIPSDHFHGHSGVKDGRLCWMWKCLCRCGEDRFYS